MTKMKGHQYPTFTKEQQQSLVFALLSNNFNVLDACKKVGIERGMYYYALINDEAFRNMLDLGKDVMDVILRSSFMEGALNEDLKLRVQYFKLLPDSVIERFLKIEKVQIEHLSQLFELNKEQFTK